MSTVINLTEEEEEEAKEDASSWNSTSCQQHMPEGHLRTKKEDDDDDDDDGDAADYDDEAGKNMHGEQANARRAVHPITVVNKSQKTWPLPVPARR